jgi:hypothetical protein
MGVATFLSLDAEQGASFVVVKTQDRPWWPGQQCQLCIFVALFPLIREAESARAKLAQRVKHFNEPLHTSAQRYAL